MLLRLCQIKSPILLALILMGCSGFKREKIQDTELLANIEGQWFKSAPKGHKLLSHHGVPEAHPFFDIDPEISKDDVNINVFVVTPSGSDHHYLLDLPSGQRYYSHSYCAQNDVWSQYSGALTGPGFSVAVIPRLMDQLGLPQTVIVFGGDKKFQKYRDDFQHRVRIVGAVVEQLCLEGNCIGKENWVSHMVFIAVDPEDKDFRDVIDLKTLQAKINWKKHKATLENYLGRNGKTYPYIRIGKLISPGQALMYYKKNSIYLSPEESKKIRNGCIGLYEKLWEEVGRARPEDLPAKTKDELNAKIKLKEELKKKKSPIGFAARWSAFIKKYNTQMGTCLNFIYGGNVNEDREKFWFFNFVKIYLKLHAEGFYYDCKKQIWQKNVINSEGDASFDFMSNIDNCRDADLDFGMKYLPNFLISLKNDGSTYFRFIDYDNHSFGSHQKIYNWVKVNSKQQQCNHDINLEIKKNLKIFPDEIKWIERDVKDLEDDLKIIY